MPEIEQMQKIGGTGAGVNGPFLLGIKDHFVANGWTVRGSGDGISRHGDIDAATTVPGAQQGSGGDYDCWSVANTSDGVAGGAGNVNSWCWLRSPSGDFDVLLGGPHFASTTNGKWAVSRSDASGFVGGSTDFETLPATPSGGADEELWLIGSRGGSGSLHNNTTNDIYGTFVLLDDGDFYWFSTRDSTGNPIHASSAAARFAVLHPHPDDPDPYVYLQTRFNVATPFRLWDWISGAWATASDDGGDGMTYDPDVGTYETARQVSFRANGGGNVPKGQVNGYLFLAAGGATFGDRYTDEETGDVYLMVYDGDQWLFLWEDGVDHDFVAGNDLDLFTITRQPAAAAGATYVNRVWDTSAGGGSGGFVRWTSEGAEDPAGASYPGPGTFGVDTSDYVVEQIR